MIRLVLRNFIFILVSILCFVSISEINPVVGLAFAARPAPKTPWLTPWLYRKTVVIENYANNRTFDAYQIKIVLDSSNFDFSAAKPQAKISG